MSAAPYPRERTPVSDTGHAKSSALVATCPACRRSVTPRQGSVGLECPRCGGFLPRAKAAGPRGLRTSSPEPTADLAAKAARQVLAELASHAGSVGDVAALQEIAGTVVARYERADAERAARRRSARQWRAEAPEIAEVFGL